MMSTTGPAANSAARSLVLRLRRGAGELSRFGVVGLGAFVIDIGIFNLLVHVGDPGVLGEKPLTAKAISAVVATVVAYQINREWTWKDRSRRGFWREYSLYFLLNGLGLLITLVPLAVSRYLLDLNSAIADNVSANVVGVGLGTLFKFWAYRSWVFPAVQEETEVGGATANQGQSPPD